MLVKVFLKELIAWQRQKTAHVQLKALLLSLKSLLSRERERESQRARDRERNGGNLCFTLIWTELRARIVSAQGKGICDRTSSKFVRQLTGQLKTRALN